MEKDLIFEGIESTADAIQRAYSQTLRKKLQEYWMVLDDAAGMEPEDFRKRFKPGKKSAWANNVIYHVNDLKKAMSNREFQTLPNYITDQEKLMAGLTEFNYLFPEDELVKSFLPVLLTGYLQRRKPNDSFVENLYTYQHESGRLIAKRAQTYLRIPPLEETYKGLYHNPLNRKVSSKNTNRAFSIYRRIMVFFLILEAVSCSCNVPLSFYIYDVLTGALTLMGGCTEKLIDEVENLKPEEIWTDHEELREKIMKCVVKTRRSFSKIRTVKPCKSHPIPQENPQFLIFLGNLRSQLYDGENKDDFDDDSDLFATLDRLHYSEDQRPMYDGIDIAALFTNETDTSE